MYIITFIQNIARTIKKMSVNEIRDHIFENCYKIVGFSKACTQINRKKKPDPRYAKEHYQLIKRIKNIKSLNQSE